MTMITPSSELTLTKGTSPAGLNEFALPPQNSQHLTPLEFHPYPPSKNTHLSTSKIHSPTPIPQNIT